MCRPYVIAHQGHHRLRCRGDTCVARSEAHRGRWEAMGQWIHWLIIADDVGAGTSLDFDEGDTCVARTSMHSMAIIVDHRDIVGDEIDGSQCISTRATHVSPLQRCHPRRAM